MKLNLLFIFLIFLVLSECNQNDNSSPRVRREWRSLSKETRKKVANAFWTLKTTSTEEGRKIYGENFNNHDEMLMLHSCAVMDPKCDVGHFGPQFMTFHRALLLKYERSLLSVDPSIEAMPYWNIAYDAIGGKFRHTNNYIYSNKYFGDLWTKKEDNYAVTNGLFAYFPISKYSRKLYGKKSWMAEENRCIKEEWFKPSPCDPEDENSEVYLRAHSDCTPYVSRNPLDGPNGNGYGIAGSYEIVYSEREFDICTKKKFIKNWMDWQNCVEFGTSLCYPPFSNSTNEEEKRSFINERKINEGHTMMLEGINCLSPDIMGSYIKNGKVKYVNFLHSQVHIKSGLDLLDVTTSPNDAAGFTGYHSNIDRSCMIWQKETQEIQNDYWGYPKNISDLSAKGQSLVTISGPFSIYDLGMCSNNTHFSEYVPMESAWLPSTTLDEVVNSGFSFKNLFDCKNDEYDSQGHLIRCDGGNDGYTHREILYWTSPSRTPYIYDTMI